MKRHSRALVIGLPGSGKTTFARKLAEKWGIEPIESDVFWNQESPTTLSEKVKNAVTQSSWIIEGHFTKVGHLILPRAEIIFYLDYPLPVVLFRFMKRRQGDFFWLIRNWRKSLAAFERTATNTTLPVVRFTHPRESERFLREC